jgi:hypothetical protein
MKISSRSLALDLGFAALILSALMQAAATTATPAQEAEEIPKDIIAVQIRKQGFSCDHPLTAERDRDRSKPDEPVWILSCDNAKYRVRLIPDMAADVQRLD